MSPDRIDLQNAEFDALTKLCEAWDVLKNTAVVDDDYPAMRHRYEDALETFIVALWNNGRFRDRKW